MFDGFSLKWELFMVNGYQLFDRKGNYTFISFLGASVIILSPDLFQLVNLFLIDDKHL